MAQTKKKRRSKHRGTPAGTIERAGRPNSRSAAGLARVTRRSASKTRTASGVGATSTQLPLPHWMLAVQVVALLFFGTQAPALQ